jgi:hypothetical protein
MNTDAARPSPLDKEAGMVHGNDRMLAVDDLEHSEKALLVPEHTEPDELSEREAHEVDVVLDRFQQAIDQEIAKRIGDDDALNDRLKRVRSTGADLADPTIAYAHTVVTLWMRLMLAADSPVGLAERALDEIATETVARAVGSAGGAATALDEPARTVAFLARCADHLPAAYQAWNQRAGVPNAEEVEEFAAIGLSFLSVLRRRMEDSPSVASLLGDWGHSEPDVEAIIAHTRKALHANGERR